MIPEQPLYVLQQHRGRAVIPKTLSLIVLAVIFYVGVLLNLSFLQLSGREETMVKLGTLVLLVGITGLGTVLAWHHASQPYLFYRNKVLRRSEEFAYALIQNTTPKQDLLDKMFKSYSIHLSNSFVVRNIPQSISLQQYLEQLKAYAARAHPP